MKVDCEINGRASCGNKVDREVNGGAAGVELKYTATKWIVKSRELLVMLYRTHWGNVQR